MIDPHAHAGLAWRVAWRWSRQQGVFQVEELASIAYLAMVQAAERYEPERGATFATYAMMKMHFAIKEELRKWRHTRAQKNNRTISVPQPDHRELSPALAASLPYVGPSALDALTDDEDRHRLNAAIAALPARQREVLTLYYFGEERGPAIAARLGVTESRVSQLRSKALATLHAQLGTERAA